MGLTESASIQPDKAAVDAGDVEVGGGLAGHRGVKGAGFAEGHGERRITGDAVGSRKEGVEGVECLRDSVTLILRNS